MKPDVPVLHRADYYVKDVDQATARALVEEHHYAGRGSNTAVYRHGLFSVDDDRECLGVAWWLPTTKVAAQSVHQDWRRVIALSRLVVVPGVPQNGASYLMARSIAIVRKTGRWSALVTWADEGQGHTGAIYRATNWEDRGPGSATDVWIDEGGRHVARKSASRTRTVAEMETLGYTRVGRSRKRKFVIELEAA